MLRVEAALQSYLALEVHVCFSCRNNVSLLSQSSPTGQAGRAIEFQMVGLSLINAYIELQSSEGV